MAHALDLNKDGTANLVLNRLPGWHALGTVWQPGDTARLDLAEAIRLGNLGNWNVRTLNIYAHDHNGDPIAVDDSYKLTVRNNPTNPDAPAQPLGVVGSGYIPIQNEEAFAFGEALIDEGLEVEAAGSLHGGRQTFVLFRVPTTVQIGDDVVVPYLHVATSHDASLAVTAKATGIRVVCANTQAMSLNDRHPRYTCRHSGEGLDGKLADARAAIGLTYAELDTFQADMDRWLHTPATEDQFQAIVARSFPKPDKADTLRVARWDDRLNELHAVAQLDTNKPIAGTAWGALQTLTEWNEWTRGLDKSRAGRGVTAQSETFRNGVIKDTRKVLAMS